MQQDFPRPQNYPYKDVFYFDGEIALIKGRYKDSESDSIGMRWVVGESELGYPSTFGNAMWMVVPDQLAGFILEGIFSDLVALRKNIRDFQEFMDALDLIRDRKIISVNNTCTLESQHLRGF